jgi:3',5'-cyclic AMP phosphodiesterase CpdA
LRIIHLSDIHVWRYALNPLRLFSKRAVGMAELVLGRGRKFRLERLHAVVERVLGLAPDHLLITGDLTTTALADEFRDARQALAGLLLDSGRVTVIPGNHDRYTNSSVRLRHFEEWFGVFAPPGPYPWLRPVGPETAILGLDATRPHLTATGRLPPEQLARARALIAEPSSRPSRLIVACHYPLSAPPAYAHELAPKRLKNADAVAAWLSGIGPHLYCCGHVHAAWAFTPTAVPGQLCLNAGAPLLRDPTGLRPPGFLEIVLGERDVTVTHHAWSGASWSARPLHQATDFFPEAPIASKGGNRPSPSIPPA